MWTQWKRNLAITLGFGVAFGVAGIVLAWPLWLTVAVAAVGGWVAMTQAEEA